MAKQRYGIPHSLDSSYMDMEIAIQSNEGIGLRPFPIKNILLVIAAITSVYLILSKTIVGRGTFLQKAIFVVSWGVLCYMILITDRTKQMGIQKILSVINYFQSENRHVNTRSMSHANPFFRICGYEEIDEDGMIKYCDKSYGIAFDIIGNGSNLLFEDHKEAIIDRTDIHYRKMRPKTTYHYITTTESQKVYLQIASLLEKKESLTVSDPDLDAMIDTNLDVMKRLVGQSLKSLHQYLIIQTPNKEEMEAALNVFWGETDSSSLMFKYAEQLYADEISGLMREIYGEPRKN